MKAWLLFLMLGSTGATCISNHNSDMGTAYYDDLNRVLSGPTLALADSVEVPNFVKSDRAYWASVLLVPSYQDSLPKGNLYLGKAETPDLIQWQTQTERGTLQGIETPHHWILMAESASTLARQLRLLLSEEAKQALQLDQWNLGTQEDDPASFAWLNQGPTVSMSMLSSWQEAAFFFRYQGKFYVAFFKYHSMSATPGFYPGLDWFPEEVRMAYDLQPRP